ncbi:hypothetical protein OPU71_21065 [Niveibacterium sp. 24ML]|uniref:hypothetical protein n=1 Tax=Niveibacterium sp. 24ML TaxID=2985512 RepID=UPI00226D5070|nr:hypothetical protein [Niveibacterium sp. 24ML]MCX9158612.1 hypothetical protein [Niveibacterium sp. 24ML]
MPCGHPIHKAHRPNQNRLESLALRDTPIAFYDKIHAAGRAAEAVEFNFIRTKNDVERAFGGMMTDDALREKMMLEAAARVGNNGISE